MTELEHSLPQNPERPFLPEGFIIPEDPIIIANVIREYYEGVFIHKMIRTPDMPEEFHTPKVKDQQFKMQFALVKCVLTEPDFDAQVIFDSLDFEALANEENELNTRVGNPKTQAYQLENGYRTTLNQVTDVYTPKIDKMRKIVTKRYIESKKIAEENNVPEEDVFTDQQLYFQLMKRCSSPEDQITQAKEVMEFIKVTQHILTRNNYRMDMLIANADNQQVTIDQIDKKISQSMDTPSAKIGMQEAIQDSNDYLHRAALAMIERYWGEKTAQFFK